MAKKKRPSNPAVLAQQYELVAVDALKPHPANPNRGNAEAIAQSIRTNGFYGAVVVQRSTGFILAGNHRWDEARKAGIAQVPVIWLDVTDAEARRILVADNRTTRLGTDDDQQLAELLQGILSDSESLEGTGYSGEDLDRLLDELATGVAGGLPDGGEIQMDHPPQPPVDPEQVAKDEATPEAQVEAVTTLGDCWRLGAHRLLCGDSSDPSAATLVMNGEKAGLMNTDPPYGVAYANDERPNPGVAKPRVAKPRVAKPRVAKDDLRGDDLRRFLEQVFETAKVVLRPDAAWYVWNAYVQCGLYVAAAAAAAAVHLSREIVWVKPVLLLGRGQYHWKHECAFFGWLDGNHSPPDYGRGNGERNQTTIWEIAGVTQAERKEFNHSTPKPVELFRIPIIKHLKPGEICYEPFAGSGPQFIAAESAGMRCYGLELEPRFCDVIVRRWQQYTGQQATLNGDGRTFEEIERERTAVAA